MSQRDLLREKERPATNWKFKWVVAASSSHDRSTAMV
jgi:hypothetical protein